MKRIIKHPEQIVDILNILSKHNLCFSYLNFDEDIKEEGIGFSEKFITDNLDSFFRIIFTISDNFFIRVEYCSYYPTNSYISFYKLGYMNLEPDFLLSKINNEKLRQDIYFNLDLFV